MPLSSRSTSPATMTPERSPRLAHAPDARAWAGGALMAALSADETDDIGCLGLIFMAASSLWCSGRNKASRQVADAPSSTAIVVALPGEAGVSRQVSEDPELSSDARPPGSSLLRAALPDGGAVDREVSEHAAACDVQRSALLFSPPSAVQVMPSPSRGRSLSGDESARWDRLCVIRSPAVESDAKDVVDSRVLNLHILGSSSTSSG